VASRPPADGASQRLVHSLPDPVQAPPVEDGVDEQPERLTPRPAAPRWLRQQRRQLRPLGVREVTGIEEGRRPR
jgi:hypothetical protein